MLLSAYRRRGNAIEPMPDKWPQLYEHTRGRYESELRAQLLPLAQRLGQRDVAWFLRTRFDVDWRASTTEGDQVIHREKALHKVRYSCRPLFTLARCRLEQDEASRDVLAVRSHADDDRAEFTHRVKPGPAFGQLESLRGAMSGRKSRTHMGILSKRSYTSAITLIPGRAPVVERPKRGFKVKQAWQQRPSGQFEEVDPRMVR